MTAGCNQSGSSPSANDNNTLCSAITDAKVLHCSVNSREHSVAIVIDTSDEAAWNLCTDIAQKLKPQTSSLTGQWKLLIYSPYRDDKPQAYCPLR